MKNANKFLAGAIATIPMTILMVKWFKHLPADEKYPLSPRVISMNLAQDFGFRKKLSENQRLIFALFNHFAYGAHMVLGSSLGMMKTIDAKI